MSGEGGEAGLDLLCYVCGRKAPEDYYSDRRTDSGRVEGGVDWHWLQWGDVALVLCLECATRGEAMPDAEAFAFYSAGSHWTKTKRTPSEWSAVAKERLGEMLSGDSPRTGAIGMRAPTPDFALDVRGFRCEAPTPQLEVRPADDLRESLGSDVAAAREPLSGVVAAGLSYMQGYESARQAGQKRRGAVSPEWVLNQLAGMTFSDRGSAHDFMRRAIEAEDRTRAEEEAAERARIKPRARYEVVCSVDVDDDAGGSRGLVEEAFTTILDDAVDGIGSRCGLLLLSARVCSVEFLERVTP